MTVANPPFHIQRRAGIVFVDSAVDQAFRKALIDGVPREIRSKMVEALAATPDKGAMAQSIRYFGDELADIKNRIAPLLIALNELFGKLFNLPGLFDWLEITGFGNDYRMIKAFAAWAEMAKTPSIGVISEQPKKMLNG